jgi:hypothetical protein
VAAKQFGVHRHGGSLGDKARPPRRFRTPGFCPCRFRCRCHSRGRGRSNSRRKRGARLRVVCRLLFWSGIVRRGNAESAESSGPPQSGIPSTSNTVLGMMDSASFLTTGFFNQGFL